jgi:hypothetical protein
MDRGMKQEKDTYSFDGDGNIDCISMGENGQIMRLWEQPIMEASAEVICEKGGDILNIGHGMGLIDDAIQRQDIKSHTIIEVNTQVLQELKTKKYRNCTIIEEDWWWAFRKGIIGKYDGIYIDTAQNDRTFHAFIDVARYFCKPGATISWFNSINGRMNHWGVWCDYRVLKFPKGVIPECPSPLNNYHPSTTHNYIPVFRPNNTWSPNE